MGSERGSRPPIERATEHWTRRGDSIGIDFTAAVGHAPGVGRYARELVRALVRLDPDQCPPLSLIEVGRGPRPMEGAPLGLSGEDVRVPFRRRRLALPRRLVAAAAQRLPRVAGSLVTGRSRLFHRVHAEWPPTARVPATLAVAEFPPSGSPAEARFARATRSAAGLFVFSEDAARRLARDFGVRPDAIHRTPVGSDHWERDAAQRSAAPGDELRGVEAAQIRRIAPDILVLGAVRSSRLPLAVLRGFEALRADGVEARLRVVGRAGDATEGFRAALAASPVRGSVRWIEEPDEARMPGCVSGAAVLLHLALDEATPVTPLEAARVGVPVVSNPLPAFQEALGSQARFADPEDPRALARALAGALEASSDPMVKEALRKTAEPYTWRACAIAHARAWQSILLGPPSPTFGSDAAARRFPT